MKQQNFKLETYEQTYLHLTPEIGNTVKLCFGYDPDTINESMWVLVMNEKNGIYEGFLSNYPSIGFDILTYADPVFFKKENVICFQEIDGRVTQYKKSELKAARAYQKNEKLRREHMNEYYNAC